MKKKVAAQQAFSTTAAIKAVRDFLGPRGYSSPQISRDKVVHNGNHTTVEVTSPAGAAGKYCVSSAGVKKLN